MQFDGAVISEQGITFAIVMVKSHVFNSSKSKEDAALSFSQYFPNMPIVLARQSGSRVEYWGRKDISKFLGSIDPRRIPWKRYSAS